MNKIIAVAAGMLNAKKQAQVQSSLYLNYGLLGLVTKLHDKGYNVEMFQGDYKTVPQIIQEITYEKLTNAIVLLSVPSFLNVDWAIAFLREIKKLNTKVLIGGRWVLDNNYEWAKEKFGQYADGFSLGCPDDCVEYLADPEKWQTLEEQKKYTCVFDKLNYSLLNNYRIYQPSIEVSRGCGSGCAFCLEKNFKPCRLKSPEQIFKEISYVQDAYGTKDLNFYFESSIFLPSAAWAEKFLQLYIRTESSFKWRCTTRVDRIKPEIISILSEAGLKVIDFGLESASPSQLTAMNKTANPQGYLQKADNLFKLCHKNGIWCKLNILLYAGETYKTFNQTKQWLTERRQYIKGISVNPYALYLNGDMNAFCDKLESITKRKINREELLIKGITYPDLSEEIDAQTALKLCKQLTELMMSESDYYDLKQIGYSERKV